MIKRFKKIAVITLVLMILSTLSVFATSITSLEDFQKELNKNFTARQNSFTLNYTGNVTELSAEFTSVFNKALSSDDYLNCSILSYDASASGIAGNMNTIVNATYVDTALQEAYVTSKVPVLLNQIITTNMTDGQMVKAVYNWLITHVTYDNTLQKHSAYDALMGSSVCQGYALLMYKMLIYLGVPAHIVIGTLEGEGHAWNECQIGGVWYFFDATNGVNNKVDCFGQSATSLANKSYSWVRTDYPVVSSEYPYESISAVASGGTHIAINDLIMTTNPTNPTTQGWKQSGTTWNYLKSDGTKTIGWLQIAEKWYYLGYNGSMVTGWNLISGKWYYLNSNGSMVTGWIQSGDTWYYLNSNGDMAIGWKQLISTWYYLNYESGAMAVNTIIGGYYLGSNGAMQVKPLANKGFVNKL